MSAIARARPALPVLQLTRQGAVWHDRDRGLERLRDEFDERHLVKVPQLIEPQLLQWVDREIERAQFRERAHHAIATELCMQENACTGLLQFLVNDTGMYRLIEEVSGCRPISFFLGRVYRRLPNGRHYDSWHSDVHVERQVGMSVNLSADVYEGGVLEVRDADSERALASIANVGFGDAILFRIAPALEHRVSDVTGAFPKTAYAGWFGGARDYLAEFRADPFVADQM